MTLCLASNLVLYDLVAGISADESPGDAGGREPRGAGGHQEPHPPEHLQGRQEDVQGGRQGAFIYC